MDDLYEDWSKGKCRSVSHDTFVNRRNLCARFVEWAKGRGAYDLGHVSVNAAREFVKELIKIGKSNKTQRTYCGYLWTNDAMARHYDHAKHLKELTEAVGKI